MTRVDLGWWSHCHRLFLSPHPTLYLTEWRNQCTIPYEGHCSSCGGLVGWVGEAEWYFTTVSHQVLMEVKQLLSNVFRAGTLLLVILKIQQHVDLQKHTQVWLWYKPCSTATKSNVYLVIVFEWDVGTSVLEGCCLTSGLQYIWAKAVTVTTIS